MVLYLLMKLNYDFSLIHIRLGVLPIYRVDEIIGYVGTGVCEPLYAKIGEINVVVKTYNNVQSNRILANELICFKIAKLLGLPIPEAGLCIIDKDTIMNSDFILDEECYGVGFYSTRVNKATRATITPNIINNFITNKSDILKIILFDHLIRNEDRHRSNFLLELSGTGKIIIIDHSHVFKLGSLWDQCQLEIMIKEEDYKANGVLLNNQSGYQVFFESIDMDEKELIIIANDFKRILSGNILDEIIYDLPQEWGINKLDKDKLIEYLKYRLGKLSDMCCIIRNHSY